MTERPQLLLRYLRQQAELGGGRIFLDALTAAQALALVHAVAPAATGPERTSLLGQIEPVTAPAAGERMATPQLRVRETLAAPLVSRQIRSSDALQVLQSAASQCTRCRLSATRTNVVFGEGSAQAELVVVGEAPGQEEDRTGRPFVGRAGKLLDLLLMSAGFPRADVYICNVLKCRPPDNRNPLPDEVAPCTTNWLNAQIAALAPRVLVAAGKFAAQVLTGTEASMGRLRGRVFGWRGTPVVVTYHPAYLLRSPHMTRVAWDDFQLARRVLHEARPG